jgi:hypothetical protein
MENNDKNSEHYRMLTPGDIAAIVDAMAPKVACPVSREDLVESVKFYKNLNTFLDDSRKTVWKTVLILIITGCCGMIGAGIVFKSNGGGH